MDFSSRKENSPTTKSESSAPSNSPSQKDTFFRRRTKSISAVLRRVNSEWFCLVSKLKSSTQATYSDEAAFESLFESSDDDFFERIPKNKRGGRHSAPEIKFLNEYKRYGSLDRYYEATRDESPNTQMPSKSSDVKLYRAVDVSRVRDELSGGHHKDVLVPSARDLSLSKHEATVKDALFSRDANLGNALWEIRRGRWLVSDVSDDADEKVAKRAASRSIKHIPRDMHRRLYRDFVEKGKPLKESKRINLEDMVTVINAGWHHEKVWDAAAKGLPA